MRRGLSLFLILFFGLGPLAAGLAGSDESRLPACCRRHGAHHCAMPAGLRSRMAASSEPLLAAPSTCPSFPAFASTCPAPAHALPASASSMPVLLARQHSPAASRAAARLSQIRTRAGRGPPSIALG